VKISEVTPTYLREYLRLDATGDETTLTLQMIAAKQYIINHTGLLEADLDKYEDLTIVLLVLVSDMYDNRLMTVSESNINRVVDNIIESHRNNFIL